MSYTVAQLESQVQRTNQALANKEITQAGYNQWMAEQNKLIEQARIREAQQQQAQQQPQTSAATASNAYWTTVNPSIGSQGITAAKEPMTTAVQPQAPVIQPPTVPAAPTAPVVSNAYWTTVNASTGVQGVNAERYENKPPPVVSS
ncbi:MAG: hypothetical protein LBE70_05350, partial [Nitrososphaerota archaeon]|nr:hypothetical protein [Nitrososphaerota archaeon]